MYPKGLNLPTYMQVLGLGFVIEIRKDQMAQTQNPYVILNPYYWGWFMRLVFLIHAFPFD